MPPVDAVLIAGPTASGKSALALALAERLDGVVINADSMQVYGDLRIITARPTPDEEARVPHRLYGHVDAAVNHSVGHYLADARAAITAAQAAGRVPIVCGGTGLYFKALTQGLSRVPPVPDAVRAAVRADLDRLGPEGLHAVLAERDPAAAARLAPRDRLRVARALEVLTATGRPLAAWQAESEPAVLAGARVVPVFLAPDRADLYARIDARFVRMIEAGALDEVRALGARGLDPLLPAMRAHGVPGLLQYLAGTASLEQAITKGQADTRHYAKRQHTWFRHQLPDWPWVRPARALDDVLARVGALAAS
ncbi:tRNA (adenosine(37)-N6)-dimethylallyltransferase MiaA [Rhodoplanes serenus]|uniref:tRNA dimethylallyltransferase n=1 Tax=Rhodoplanes serenus TaxID=200615 RepID=A0A9X4XLD1_9BRAD|nr:tRNA (adenosine(37)-N6)-dimethylallyltransferase MiaA [Rhodoplanes serenus]MTW17248.1 tRNA (adenosine(37)-N6)-dimethylallyltransferase MiaA [Rhodoplanes serenus]